MSDEISDTLKAIIKLQIEVKGLSIKVENTGKETKQLFDFHNARVQELNKWMTEIKDIISGIICPKAGEIEENTKKRLLLEEKVQDITLKRPWREDLIKNLRTVLAIIAGVLGIMWALKRFGLWESL